MDKKNNPNYICQKKKASLAGVLARKKKISAVEKKIKRVLIKR